MAERGYLQKCRCGEMAILQTSWTKANPGRRFLGCNRYQSGDGCNFFKWFDRPLPYKLVGLLHKEEAGTKIVEDENEKKEQKPMKCSWMKLFAVFVIGTVVGRFSVSCSRLEFS